MRVEFINPFIKGAVDVIKAEANVEPTKGALGIEESAVNTQEDLTVLIGVTGKLQGVVMYSLSERTAKNLVSTMLGEPIPIYNEMVESAIAEMGNVITGIASAELEAAGIICKIAPPTMVQGRGVIISTINIKRLVIPLSTSLGDIKVSVALKEL